MSKWGDLESFFTDRDLKLLVNHLEQEYSINCAFDKKKYSFQESILSWYEMTIYLKVIPRTRLGAISILCHFFGHLVLISESSDYLKLIEGINKVVPPTPLSLKIRDKYFKVENLASKYGLGLMENTMGFSISSDQILAYQAYMHTDFNMYWNYLLTNKKLKKMEFLKLFNLRIKEIKNNPQLIYKSCEIPKSIRLNKLKFDTV